MKVKVVALGSVVDVELPDRATIADAEREARVESGLDCRYKGDSVPADARASTRVGEGDTLVFTPPSVKHGI
jgi:hypothetical protein